jgi:hypothetical protein
MKKLITPNEKLKELDNLFLKGEITIHQFRIKMMEYFTFLDQLLTKEMFNGDKAIFVGFRMLGSVISYKDDSKALLIFAVSGQLAWDYINEKGMQETHYFKENANLHDLAELTKSNQLELK